MIGKKKTAILGLVALVALLGASAARAVRDKDGNLEGAFHGTIAPAKLPRHGSAPVAVQMGGKITTTDKSVPPKLERVILEINRFGVLQRAGLPTCPLAKLNSISSAGAKKACGGALVGHGNVTSRVVLPGQGAFASNGPLLAFNGRYKGGPAIFAQVATGAPLPLTYVIIFQVKRHKGTFGTSLIGTVPPIASEYGYISAFDLLLKRTYTYHGQELSYASASCPAPDSLSGAIFQFARVSYEFAGKQVLTGIVERSCRAKG